MRKTSGESTLRAMASLVTLVAILIAVGSVLAAPVPKALRDNPGDCESGCKVRAMYGMSTQELGETASYFYYITYSKVGDEYTIDDSALSMYRRPVNGVFQAGSPTLLSPAQEMFRRGYTSGVILCNNLPQNNDPNQLVLTLYTVFEAKNVGDVSQDDSYYSFNREECKLDSASP